MDTISAQSRDHLRQTIIDEIKSSEETTRALISRLNALAPISRLPPETLAIIFTFLSASAWHEAAIHLEWIRVAHVCHRWRETALNYPRFWSHINFSKLTPADMGEILARAKMAPLYLEGEVGMWNAALVDAFERQLEAHIFHTRHLSLSGFFKTALARLSSSAPTLESLSFSHHPPLYGLSPVIIPDNLLNCTAPNLTSLKLEYCDISWKSPLLKGLRILEIANLSAKAMPKLNDWLDALNDMPQLKELSLEHATPLAPPADPLILRTVTLPSLTNFHIGASANDCALALAHLVLPALTWLHVDVVSYDREGQDVLLVIPYVVRNVCVLQDVEPIRSILIAGETSFAEVVTWTMPGADVKVCGLDTLVDMLPSACLLFAAKNDEWNYGVETTIFDALLTLLPMNSVSTLTAHNRTRLGKESWLRHASRLPLLEQARLVPSSVGAFWEMLAEDTPPYCPRLPSLTRLILLDVTLTALRTYHCRGMLIKRVEQGVPLEVLDLSTCDAADRAIQLLAEIVVDVQEPLGAVMEMDQDFNHVEIGYCDEVECDDGQGSWYGDMDDVEGEDEYEDEDEDEDEDEAEHAYDEFDYGDEFLEHDIDYYF